MKIRNCEVRDVIEEAETIVKKKRDEHQPKEPLKINHKDFAIVLTMFTVTHLREGLNQIKPDQVLSCRLILFTVYGYMSKRPIFFVSLEHSPRSLGGQS